MAFALTKVEAFGVQVEKAVTSRYIQYLVLTVTGANSDVSLDLDEFVAGSLGTFWDAVDGSEPGDTALQAARNISTKAQAFLGIQGSEIGTKAKIADGATAADDAYKLEVAANHFPDITYNTSDAPTSATYVLSFLLKSEQEPEEVSATA